MATAVAMAVATATVAAAAARGSVAGRTGLTAPPRYWSRRRTLTDREKTPQGTLLLLPQCQLLQLRFQVVDRSDVLNRGDVSAVG